MKYRDSRGRFVKKYLNAGSINLEFYNDKNNWGISQNNTPNWYLNLYNAKFLTPDTDSSGNYILNPNKSNSTGTSLVLTGNNYDYRETLSLDRAFKGNQAYTSNYTNVKSDLQNYANSFTDINSFVDTYNADANKIRNSWSQEKYLYNNTGWKDHNATWNKMFTSRLNATDDSRIVYSNQNGLDDYLGSSTWLRRMDRYETEFDPTNITKDSRNRIYEIAINGSRYYVYKKANGDIGYLTPEQTQLYLSSYDVDKENAEQLPAVTTNTTGVTGTSTETHLPAIVADWNTIGDNTNYILSGNKTWNKTLLANALEAFRVGTGLAINNKITNRAIEAEKPLLIDPIEHHKPIYGNLRAKMEGEQHAAQLLNAASRPVTSDANLQLATLLEAQLKGNEFIQLGNTVDDLMMRTTAEAAWQQEKENRQNRYQAAMTNRLSLLETQKNIANLKNIRDNSAWTLNIAPWLMGIEQRLRTEGKEQEALTKQFNMKNVQNEVLFKTPIAELGITDPDQIRVLTDYRNDPTAFITRISNDQTGADYDHWVKVRQKLNEIVMRKYYQAAGANIPDSSFLQDANYSNQFDPNQSGFFNYYLYPQIIWGPVFKSGGTIYKAKLSKRTKDYDRGSKSIEKSKELAAKFLEQSIDALYTYSDKKKKRKKKYQAGGGLPLVNFSPVFAGSENSTLGDLEDSTTKTSSSDLTDKDMLNILKSMDALPNDISVIINNLQNFKIEKDLDPSGMYGTQNIAQRYFGIMKLLKIAQFNYKQYDKAIEQLRTNGGLNELAVTSWGQFIGFNYKTGDYQMFTADQVNNGESQKQGYQILTNADLLHIRSNSPTAVFDNQLLTVAQGGISMQTVTKYINDIVLNLGKSTEGMEGYTQVQANQILQGVEYIKDAATKLNTTDIVNGITVDGLYKNGYVTEDQADQMQLALNYILTILPENAKALLKVKSGGGDEAVGVIKSLIASKTSVSKKFTTDLVKDPSTSSTKSSGSNKTLMDTLEMDPVTMLLAGYGEKQTITIQTSNGGMNGIEVPTIKMPIVTKEGKSIGVSKLSDVTESAFAGYLDFDNASIGGVMIDPMASDKVAINGTALYVGYLPIDVQEFYTTGNIKPDIDMLPRYKEALAVIKEKNITDPNEINQIYQEYHLPIMFDQETGSVLQNYRKFGMMNASALSTAFNENVDMADYISEVTDENQIKNTLDILQKGRAKEDRIDFDSLSWFDSIFGTGYDRVYAGTVFIPVNEDYFTGVAATGKYPKVGEANEIEARLQAVARQSTYINPGQL